MCLLISECCAPAKLHIKACCKFLNLLVIVLLTTKPRRCTENSVNYNWKPLWIIQHLKGLTNLNSFLTLIILGSSWFSSFISVSFIYRNKSWFWRSFHGKSLHITDKSSYIWIPMCCEETERWLVWWSWWNRSHYAVQLLPEHLSVNYSISLQLQRWGCTKALHITHVPFLTVLLNLKLHLKSV